MKKAYLYFLLPLAGLAIFGVFYWQFSKDYQKHQEQRDAAIRETKQAKVDEENRNREKALVEAKKAQEERRKVKAEKEARDAKDKEDRELARGALQKARADEVKLAGQVTRLTKEIEDAKKEKEKIEDDKAHLVAEEIFLKEYVKQVVANRASLQTVVEKIDAADKAAEAAAKEAAAKEAAARKK